MTRLHREAVRSPARSVGNLEFHRNYHHINEVAHRVAMALEREGIPALNPAAGFPMEMDRFPGRIWVVSHKPVAVAAGLGQIGIHRSVIHPVFGSFINLATVLVAADVEQGGCPARLQSVPELQAVRGRLPGGGHRAGRLLQLLRLYDPQLPGVHGRVHRVDREHRRRRAAASPCVRR